MDIRSGITTKAEVVEERAHVVDKMRVRPELGPVVKMMEGLVEVLPPPPPKLTQSFISGESEDPPLAIYSQSLCHC